MTTTPRQIEIMNSNISPQLLDEFRKYIQDNVFEIDEHTAEFKYNTDFKYKFMQNNGFVTFLKDKCNWTNIFDIDFLSIKTANKKLEEIMEFVKEITNIDSSHFYHTYAIIKISPYTTLIFVVIGKQMDDLFLTKHISTIKEIYDPILSSVQNNIDKYKNDSDNTEKKLDEQQKIIQTQFDTFNSSMTETTEMLKEQNTLLQKELLALKTQHAILSESNTKTQNILEELIAYVFPKGKDFVVMKP